MLPPLIGNLGLLLPLLLKLPDGVVVVPSDLLGELPEKAVLVPRLQPQNLERVRDDHALGPVVRRRDTLVRLEPRQRSLSPLGLVRNHPADGAPENLGGGAEVDGPVRRLGVHPLAEEAEVLHLLADEAAGQADLLAADHHDLLAVEELLGDDRGQAAEHVVARVHHDALGADAGAGHHRGLTCEAAAAAR